MEGGGSFAFRVASSPPRLNVYHDGWHVYSDKGMAILVDGCIASSAGCSNVF